MKYLVLLFTLCFCFVACQQKSDLKSLKNLKPKNKKEVVDKETVDKGVKESSVSSSKISFLPKTSEAMSLDNSLREISGLTFDASANGLIAHDDELAILHHIDFDGREVLSKEKIGNIGDYEGVEKIGDVVYLINSAGEILSYNMSNQETQTYSTGLNIINNVEGLGYYNGSLLIACKGKPEKESGQRFDDCRALYSFSLKNKTATKVPFMLISKDMLTSFAGESSPEEIQRLRKFAPSGVAVHPETNEIYVLSHKGRMLVVCNAQAEIRKLYFLDYAKHRQPEGICFDDQSRMYIANESNEGAPVIYRYSSY